MNVRYHELKEAVYVGMAVLGAFLLGAAFLAVHNGPPLEVTSLSTFFSGIILLGAGLICVFFALVTFIIKDDPDVWR